MNLAQLIAQLRAQMATKLQERNTYTTQLETLRGVDPIDEAAVATARAAQTALDAELDQMEARLAELNTELARDEAVNRLSQEVHPTGAGLPAYDRVARIGQEERTYRPDTDKRGIQFLTDVTNRFMSNDLSASERLSRHMAEARVDFGDKLERAAGTGAFAGLTVPQYLTDMVAPLARAGRPFADACRHHDLPASGMTANISRITTGTTSGIVAENTNVSETDIDDTLLSVAVQIAAGQQTLSRAAVERGTGIEDTTLEDMMRAYATNLDSALLNQATNGLTNVATAIAYTDASPTAPELYPKMLAGPAAVEAALLDQAAGGTIAVMHSRRWYWLQSQLSSQWPLFNQPGIPVQNGGVNLGEKYGSGFRGVLPNGVAVVVDNNIATNFGAGTNEDEIYFVAPDEAHLWEDPAAPMLIRAEQPKAASLGILLVVYGYFGYTFARRPHAQKIGGTGLVTPTF